MVFVAVLVSLKSGCRDDPAGNHSVFAPSPALGPAESTAGAHRPALQQIFGITDRSDAATLASQCAIPTIS
jgi:hypothetical protein